MRDVMELPEDKSEWSNSELEKELVFGSMLKNDGDSEAKWYAELRAEYLRRFPESAKWVQP